MKQVDVPHLVGEETGMNTVASRRRTHSLHTRKSLPGCCLLPAETTAQKGSPARAILTASSTGVTRASQHPFRAQHSAELVSLSHQPLPSCRCSQRLLGPLHRNKSLPNTLFQGFLSSTLLEMSSPSGTSPGQYWHVPG